MKAPQHWDLAYDVVVGGYGFAGAMVAIAAHDDGSAVAIFEKMAHPGGNSILSGGGLIVGRDIGPTLAYLRRTCGGNTDDEVLGAFAKGMIELPELISGLAHEVGMEVKSGGESGTYPFPGSDQLCAIHVTRNEHYPGFRWASGLRGGGTMFWVLSRSVERRGIDVHLETPVRELIRSDDGAVIGVVVQRGEERLRVLARKAVVLATGGFEQNERMRSHYLQVKGAISMASAGNTGDGIMMAQKAGAALWHMWHVHGGYGFKVPGIPVAVRHRFTGYRKNEQKMPWIAVDRFARRFMNEYPPAPQDTPIRALETYDPDLCDYPRIPCYLIFDDEGRRLGPIAQPRFTDESVKLEWSHDNLAEVERGYIVRSDSIEGLAAQAGLPAAPLCGTVRRWNAQCEARADGDFRRPAETMVPLATPPYYAIAAWPIITNTQGGPVHNARQQVLDPYGRPIPRLYKAGEMGSIFGHLYMLGGNNSECFIGGQIAGRRAAAEKSWC